MPPRRLAPITAALLLVLAPVGRAQELGLSNDLPPESQATAVQSTAVKGKADPVGSFSDRPLTLGVGAGLDNSGPFVALRLGLGFSPVPDIRLDLVGTLALGQPKVAGYEETVLARASAELRVGYRLGAIRPWIGAGVLAASLDEAVPTNAVCRGLDVCSAVAPPTAQLGAAKGTVVAVGAQLAVGKRLILGAELRKAFLPVSNLGGSGLLLSMVFPVGGGR